MNQDVAKLRINSLEMFAKICQNRKASISPVVSFISEGVKA